MALLTNRLVTRRTPTLLRKGLLSPSRATITVTNLTTVGSTVDGTSVLTASKTPTANALQLLWVVSHNGSSLTGPPTVSGCGLTWVKIDDIAFTTTVRRLTLFRALGAAPTTGQLTIDFGSDTQTSFMWSWLELTGVNTSGTNGSGAIVQSKESAATTNTTATNTLDNAFENAKNLHVCGTALSISTGPPTKDANFTLAGADVVSANSNALSTEYALNRTSCTDTFASALSAMISVEVKAG